MSGRARGTLHVLTVHFNTPAMTARLVREFPRRTPKGRPVFIHVLDNSSTPQNQRALCTDIENLENVLLQSSNTNLGFGMGVNLLAESDSIIDSDLIWILNPDTRLGPRCIELLEEEIELGSFDIVSPLIYSGDEENPWIWFCGGVVKSPELRAVHTRYGCRVEEAPRGSFETAFITGAAPMMFASTFRVVGGLPADYFLYWEDAYFSWKARALGFRLGVVPTARLWHAVGASSGTGQSPTFYYWASRNRFVFGRDIGIPLRQLIIGRGCVETLRPIARALLVERTSRIPKFRAAIRGTVEGLRRSRASKSQIGSRS